MKKLKMWRKSPPLLIAVILLSFLMPACQKNIDIEKLRGLPLAEGEKTDQRLTPTVIAECAGELHDRPEIRITWSADEKMVQNQRIDLTVYKDGFEEGRFTSFLVGDQKSGFNRLSTNKGKGAEEELLPALSKLNVAKMGKKEPERGAKEQKDAEANPTMEMAITDFEPGLNYFVRLLVAENDKWVPGPVIKVVAPVCPLDQFIEER